MALEAYADGGVLIGLQRNKAIELAAKTMIVSGPYCLHVCEYTHGCTHTDARTRIHTHRCIHTDMHTDTDRHTHCGTPTFITKVLQFVSYKKCLKWMLVFLGSKHTLLNNIIGNKKYQRNGLG